MTYRDDYFQARFLTGLHCYKEAEKLYDDSFGRLGFKKDWRDKNDGYEIRKDVYKWLGVPEGKKLDSGKTGIAVEFLGDYLFLQMLIAEIYELKKDKVNKQTRWRYCMSTYAYATELMRLLDDNELMNKENAYIRTNYGGLLGKARRWYEAHRRLDEAAAYLSLSITKSASPPSWALIHLRRAELFLLRAKDKRESKMNSLALLNSAHHALEQAKENLTFEHRKNVWWWTWLYELRLTACVCSAKLGYHREIAILEKEGTCHCRFACGEGKECINSLQTGQQLSELDPFRQARLVSLFMDFMGFRKKRDPVCGEVINNTFLSTAKVSLESAVKRRNEEVFKYPWDERVRDYVNSVLERAGGMLPPAENRE